MSEEKLTPCTPTGNTASLGRLEESDPKSEGVRVANALNRRREAAAADRAAEVPIAEEHDGEVDPGGAVQRWRESSREEEPEEVRDDEKTETLMTLGKLRQLRAAEIEEPAPRRRSVSESAPTASSGGGGASLAAAALGLGKGR